jgi:hypothetical protein
VRLANGVVNFSLAIFSKKVELTTVTVLTIEYKQDVGKGDKDMQGSYYHD